MTRVDDVWDQQLAPVLPQTGPVHTVRPRGQGVSPPESDLSTSRHGTHVRRDRVESVGAAVAAHGRACHVSNGAIIRRETHAVMASLGDAVDGW